MKNAISRMGVVRVAAIGMLVITGVSYLAIANAVTTSTVSLGSETTITSSDHTNNTITGHMYPYDMRGSLHCPAGFVVTNMTYKDSYRGSSDVVNDLGIQCSKLESDGSLTNTTAWITLPDFNTNTRMMANLPCTGGSVYVSVYQKDFPLVSENSDFLDGIGQGCMTISSTGLSGTNMGYQGNSDLDGSSRELANFQCPANSVIVGVDYDMYGNSYPANPTAVDSVAMLHCATVNTTTTQNITPACSTKSDCGTDGFSGGNFCQGNSVYKNYTTYTCNNPGTASAFCSNSTSAQSQQTCTNNQTCSGGSCSNVNITCSSNSQCGTDGLTGGPFCQGNAVYKNYTTYTCNNAGTANSFCSNSTAAQSQQTCTSNQTCSSGACNNVTITCSSNSQCGTDGLTGGPFCQGNSVYKNYTTYTCNNAGTASSYCSNSTSAQLQNTCTSNQTCSGGACSNLTVACSANSQCGTDGFTSGAFCQNNAVYKNYTTYTCNNSGTASSYCSNSTTAQLQNTCASGQTCSSGSCTTTSIACSSNSQCGTDGLTGGNFCQNNAVYRNHITYTCNNSGTANSYCSNSTTAQLQQTCTSNQTCSSGSCTNLTIACSANSDCGTNAYTGGSFCQSNSVYKNYITYTCNNAGTASSYCSNSTAAQLQQTCNSGQTCSGGSCSNTSIACSSNSQCGTDGLTGGNFCQNNAVYRNYITYTCNNSGASNSYCSNSTTAQLQQTCNSNQTCSSGSCTTTNICTSNASLRCVGNAVYWFDSCGNQQTLSQTCLSTQTCSVNACVNQTQSSTLSISKTVRNLSSGNLNWSSSVSASPSDIVQFSVILQSNQTVNNVTVKDVFPANLIYNNSLTLDGVANSGNIISGMNIGNVVPGQLRTITYQAQVASSQNFNFGSTTLQNGVTATSTDSGFNPASASASVVVVKSGVLGATTVSTGLTNNFWVDSFFLPLMLALVGLWLFRSGILGIPDWVNAKKDKRTNAVAQKELQKKIMQIRKEESAV